jgi:hypothetical protein
LTGVHALKIGSDQFNHKEDARHHLKKASSSKTKRTTQIDMVFYRNYLAATAKLKKVCTVRSLSRQSPGSASSYFCRPASSLARLGLAQFSDYTIHSYPLTIESRTGPYGTRFLQNRSIYLFNFLPPDPRNPLIYSSSPPRLNLQEPLYEK